MDPKEARLLIENLIDRIETDRQTGKKKLVGNITEREWQALQEIPQYLVGPKAPLQPQPVVEENKGNEDGSIEGPNIAISKLNKTALERMEIEDGDVILCLDFGTARSKAFATQYSEQSMLRYLELGLGNRAGEDYLTYPVTSSVWIDENSRVYFGKEAVIRSLRSKEGRNRIDSLKQVLSQGFQRSPDEAPLEQAMNPTGIPLSWSHVLILYLSYLTDLAVSELEDRHGKSRYVGRRFALPSWEKERREWGESILRKYLAMAQIVGDTFHGKWKDGIDIETARNVLEEVKSLSKLPLYLLKEGVSEPIAAGSSRLRAKDAGLRNLAVVVDVGAGTTDFAAFVVTSPVKDRLPNVYPIANLSRAVGQAGNTIDECLRKKILADQGIDDGHSDFKRINAHLQLRIREYKERLFRDGAITYILQNDATGTVDLDHFLDTPRVQDFSETINRTFKGIVQSIPKSFVDRLWEGGLNIVVTGGGASLPMLRRFGEDPVYAHGNRLSCQHASIVPEEILIDYPNLESEYPQLAVAIGGAAPTLPSERGTLAEMPGLPQHGWKLGGFFTKGQ